MALWPLRRLVPARDDHHHEHVGRDMGPALEMAKHGSVDIFNVSTVSSGGIHRARKVLALAEAAEDGATLLAVEGAGRDPLDQCREPARRGQAAGVGRQDLADDPVGGRFRLGAMPTTCSKSVASSASAVSSAAS